MLARYSGFAFANGARRGITFHYPEHEQGARERIEQAFSELKIHDSAPASLVEIKDVFMSSSPTTRCLYRADGSRVDESCLRRRSAEASGFLWRSEPFIAPPREAFTVREPVLYQSICFNHWGHFLIESIGRLWPRGALAEFARMAGVFLPFSAPDDDHPNIAAFLEGAGAGGLRLPEWRSVVKLETCFVPAPTYSEGLEAYMAHADAPRALAARHLERSPVKPNSQPLYLSRTRLCDPNARRAIVNEAELEAALAARRFRIVYPEDLSLGEQIELFNSHNFIAGCWGSAFHGILFSLRGRDLTTCVLTEIFAPGNYMMMDALAGNDSHYLSVMRKIPPSDPAQTRRDVKIDVAAALHYFDSVGII